MVIVFKLKDEHFSELESEINRTLAKIQLWGTNNGLDFNPNRTKAMICTKKRNIPHLNLNMNGTPIAIDKNIKILGIIFDSRLIFSPHIDYTVKRAASAANAINRISHNTWGLSLELTSQLYKATVEPVLLYDCQIWALFALLSKLNIKKLRKVQRYMAIKIIKGYRDIKLEDALIMADLLPIDYLAHHRNRIYQSINNGLYQNLKIQKNADWHLFPIGSTRPTTRKTHCVIWAKPELNFYNKININQCKVCLLILCRDVPACAAAGRAVVFLVVLENIFKIICDFTAS